MITAKLIRYHFGINATLGILKFNVVHNPIYTLEKPWLGNMGQISCMPDGTYKVAPYTSEKFPNVYQIKDVPHRTAILIHLGNYATDTHGCVLVGMGVTPTTPMVSNSKNAMELVKHLVGNNEFTLTVENL